jgi:hypothetical protein
MNRFKGPMYRFNPSMQNFESTPPLANRHHTGYPENWHFIGGAFLM